jgi:Protein of unknown function (DUF3168)
VPRQVRPPYVAMGTSVVEDWSTGTEPGDRHVLTLQVWTSLAGRREADAIIAIMHDALHDRDLTLAGHRLVNFRHNRTETKRMVDNDRFFGLLRFVATTEPA